MSAGAWPRSDSGAATASPSSSPTDPNWPVAFLAVAAAATAVPLNPALTEAELGLALDDLRPAAIILHAGVDGPARSAATARALPILDLMPGDGPAGRFALDAPSGQAVAVADPEPDDVALLLTTSGTTARPKLVPLTHANLCASARHIAATLDLRPADRCLVVMPLFHIHGLVGALLASVAAGASVACAPGFQPARFFDWLAECRPSWYTAVPTMHGRSSTGRRPTPTSSPAIPSASSAPRPPRCRRPRWPSWKRPSAPRWSRRTG
jgi:acyl-CoA synthetase (AMP-forming)/AMP-acid ligase II